MVSVQYLYCRTVEHMGVCIWFCLLTVSCDAILMSNLNLTSINNSCYELNRTNIILYFKIYIFTAVKVAE